MQTGRSTGSPSTCDQAAGRSCNAWWKAERIAGEIPVGEARTYALSGKGAQLSNKGGTISLLDERGLKVDGVAYTKADAQREGAGIAF